MPVPTGNRRATRPFGSSSPPTATRRAAGGSKRSAISTPGTGRSTSSLDSASISSRTPASVSGNCPNRGRSGGPGESHQSGGREQGPADMLSARDVESDEAEQQIGGADQPHEPDRNARPGDGCGGQKHEQGRQVPGEADGSAPALAEGALIHRHQRR